jgi:hypothetical protein
MTSLVSERSLVSRFLLIFPSLVVSILLSPLIASALIHVFSYIYKVPVNLFSLLVALIISTAVVLRIILRIQIKQQFRFNFPNQYGTLLGLMLALLPVFSALKLASSTIWEQRFNWLYYSNEDTAAWVSLARATLQNGHLPQDTSDSEYSLYGSASTLPGVIIRILTSGKTASSHYEAVLMGVDAVLLSYLYAAVAAVALVGGFMLIMPARTHKPNRSSFFVSTALAMSIALASASLSVAFPIAQGSFLSLTWTILGTFTVMFFMYVAFESDQKAIGSIVQVLVLSCFTVSIWPYISFVYLIVAVLIVILTYRKSSFVPVVKFGLPIALVAGCAVGAIKPFLVIFQDNTFISLSSAQGLVIQRDPWVVLLGLFAAVYIVFISRNLLDVNPAIPAAVIGSIFAAALIAFATRQAGLLGEYGVAKLQYVGIVVAVIAGLLYFAIQIINLDNFRTSLLLALAVFSAINFLPQLSSITAWPSSFSVGGIGPPGDALKNKIRTMSESNFSCIPKIDDSREKAYVCNRWASALSSTNSEMDFEFRAALLSDPRDVKAIVDEFKAKGFFTDRSSVPIAEILGLDTQ